MFYYLQNDLGNDLEESSYCSSKFNQFEMVNISFLLPFQEPHPLSLYDKGRKSFD